MMRGAWLILVFFLAAPLAFAEPLEHFPGWSVAKIPAAASESESTYELGPDFYSLTPPDGRPAVTIDARIAATLKVGQGTAEDAYNKKTAQSQEKQEEYVYGASNSGYVVAELPDSTASAVPAGAGAVAPVSSPQVISSPGFSSSASSGGSRLPSSTTSSASSSPAAEAAYTPPAVQTYDAAMASAQSAGAPPANAPAAVTASPERPGELGKTEDDLNFSSRMSAESAKGVKMAGAAAAGEGSKVAKASSEGGGFGVTANSAPKGLGFESPAEKRKIQQRQAAAVKKKEEQQQANNAPKPCESLKKQFVEPGLTRVKVPEGCRLVYVTAWGGGGGRGPQTSGGGGAFVNGSGKFDAATHDLLVVVGAAGGEVANGRSGLGGYPGGGEGGASSSAPGGGGGGYSGVFWVPKNSEANDIVAANALAVAGGGGGGSGRGRNGEAGSGQAGGASGNGEGGAALLGGRGGAGLAHPSCQTSYGAPEGQCLISTPSNNPDHGSTQELVVSDFGSAGGGGGGGGIQGGGGGGGSAAAAESGNGAYSSGGGMGASDATGGGGGSSAANMDNNILEGGNGVNPGFQHYPDRGDAGSPGRHGKVILQYY